jgi:hypothetical protein
LTVDPRDGGAALSAMQKEGGSLKHLYSPEDSKIHANAALIRF